MGNILASALRAMPARSGKPSPPQHGAAKPSRLKGRAAVRAQDDSARMRQRACAASGQYRQLPRSWLSV